MQEIERSFSNACSPSLVELPKDQAVNNAIRAISNALSIATVDDLEGTMKTTCMSIVNFSNMVINNSGDSTAGHALQRGLQLVQDSSPAFVYDLSRAEIFENCAQSNRECALTSIQ